MTKQTMKHNYYFTYGRSRGQDSYGYNIVSLYVDGVKVAMSVGVGFDQHGSCFGQWLTKTYNERLVKLPANYGSMDNNKGFYGLVHYENNTYNRLHKSTPQTKTSCDGMCGRGSMFSIMQAIGVELFETKKPRKARG